jgi:hypothetical protein
MMRDTMRLSTNEATIVGPRSSLGRSLCNVELLNIEIQFAYGH